MGAHVWRELVGSELLEWDDLGDAGLLYADAFDPQDPIYTPNLLVEPDELMPRAAALAKQFQELDMRAHKLSKRQERRALVRRIRRNIPLDLLSAALQGVHRSRTS